MFWRILTINKRPTIVVNLPDNGEFYVPLDLAATLTDVAHDVTMAVARRASTIRSNNLQSSTM